MEHIRKPIMSYLNSWTECRYCNGGFTDSHIKSDPWDNPICEDCFESPVWKFIE